MLKINRIRALISKEKKLIFLWTPKSGCTTVKNIFFDYIGIDIPKNNMMFVHDSSFKKYFINKMPKEFNKYLKIQFVRNPYEKATSGFLTHLQHKKWSKCEIKENLNFNDFLEKLKSKSLIDCRQCFFHNQSQFMTKNIDEVIKIENLSEELKIINKKYNLDLKNVSYEKHSHRKQIGGSYEDFLSFENINLINQIYWKDITFFKYTKKALM